MEDILNSNIYTINIYLKTIKNPDEAVKLLKKRFKSIISNWKKKD